MVFFLFKVYKKSERAVQMNRVAEKELVDLQQRKAELEASIQRLQIPVGEEEELRSKFQIKREGEEYMVIVDEPVSVNAVVVREEKGFFEKILDFVKNIF